MHSADLAAVAGLDRSVWKEYLTDSQIQKMSRATRKYLSFELESMMELRPLLIWSFMCKILLDAHDDSLDQAIWDYAIKNAKNLNCIESIEEQMDIMNSIPLRFEFHQLRDSLLHISKTNRNLKTLIQYYEKQDISELYKKTKSSLGPNKALLLTDRNRKFADRIWRAHENEASFFCFGAAHLAGKNGVLNELKRKGAKIKELKILNL